MNNVGDYLSSVKYDIRLHTDNHKSEINEMIFSNHVCFYVLDLATDYLKEVIRNEELYLNYNE